MIDIPPEVTENLFNSSIARGTVIRMLWEFPDGSTDYKRFIIVSLNCNHPDIYHLMCTSQLRFYDENPMAADNSLRIKKGTTDIFDREAVVKMQKVFTSSRQSLLDRYKTGEIDILGDLPEEVMQAIDNKLRDSIVIERKYKKLIIAGYGE